MKTLLTRSPSHDFILAGPDLISSAAREVTVHPALIILSNSYLHNNNNNNYICTENNNHAGSGDEVVQVNKHSCMQLINIVIFYSAALHSKGYNYY